MRPLSARTDPPARWEHFSHQADIGVRGLGSTMGEAFEQAALAMTAVITPPEAVRCLRHVTIRCQAPDAELLFADWLNALIYEMADHRLLFGRYSVAITGDCLTGEAWGEIVDRARHRPTVEIKGATYTELKVDRRPDGQGWFAQAVLDV
jgi:SHS2 domain-containing protein